MMNQYARWFKEFICTVAQGMPYTVHKQIKLGVIYVCSV